MTEAERLKKVYETCVEKGLHSPLQSFEHDRISYENGKYAHLETWEKKARAMADAIINQEVYVYDFDKIIGRVYHHNGVRVEGYDVYGTYQKEARERTVKVNPGAEELAEFDIMAWGSFGHIAWAWNEMLALGTEGIRKKCQRSLERNASDKKSVEFLNGVLIMLDALEKWNEKHIPILEKMGKTEEAEIIRRVPKYPARNFREAVQSFFMQYIVVIKEAPYGGNSPGRLDYYLWPYLEKDLRDNKITLTEATTLIEEMFLRLDERIYNADTWGETVVLGGSYPSGASAVNPLTYIMLNAYKKYPITTHPSIYLRVPENAPEEYLKACADYVINGQNRAQLINDKAMVDALVSNGVTLSDAYEYFCGGCMEVGVQGKNSDLLFVGKYSVANILEFCITGGYSLVKKKWLTHFKPKSLDKFDDFESFYQSFIEECQKTTKSYFEHMDRLSEYLERERPQYLLCSMLDGCIEKGRNQHGGVVKYHDYGATVLGLANASDSLFAIKKAVFEDKICSASELIEALKADFNGYELLRKKLCAIAKYGQNDDEADEMMVRVTNDVCSAFRAYKNRFGGTAKPTILTFIYAPTTGAILGATPDGRKAGTVIAHGVTPQSASMTDGITSAINSASKLDYSLFTGGATVMWDLDCSWANEQIAEWLIRAYFNGGGQFFQGNVTSVEELIKAQQTPEKYPNLIVRVGGYSAKFVNLNRGLQDDIINRTRHKG